MQDAIAVFTYQSLNQSTLMRGQSIFINKTPVLLIEIKRLLTGNRILGIAIPCDQPELWEIPDNEEVSRVSHEASMDDSGFVFKR